MYYKGMPFNEFSLIINIDKESTYFAKKKILLSGVSLCIYEKIIDKKVVFVIYEADMISLQDIMRYNENTYSELPYQALSKIGEKTFKITTLRNNSIRGYEIIKYDNMWRESIWQILDENQLLLEYRKIYYEGNERIFAKEKIFFATSFHMSEENYS